MKNGFSIVDAHCHCYPPQIAAKAAVNIGKFYGTPSECGGTAEEILKIDAACGIDLAVIESAATVPHQVRSINEFIAENVSAHPDRFLGFGTLHPASEDPEGDVRHLLSLGLSGVKIHNDFLRVPLDAPEMDRLYDLCADVGLPVLLHAGDKRFDFTNPEHLARVLAAHPTLRVLGAHLGGYSVWEDAARILPRFPNLIVDCSSSLRYLGAEKSLEMIRLYGADRVLFGTDFPYHDPSVELDMFFSLDLTDEERGKILSGNVASLLGLRL